RDLIAKTMSFTFYLNSIFTRGLFGFASIPFVPMSAAIYLVRRAGALAGLKTISNVATGDDLVVGQIVEFSRQPQNLTSCELNIPEALDEELRDKALKASSKMVARLYNLDKAPADAAFLTSVVEAVRISMTDLELVHSQYYQREEIIDQIAMAIATGQPGA